MSDVIVHAQQVKIEITFVVRINIVACLIEEVFVAIQSIRIKMSRNLFCISI